MSIAAYPIQSSLPSYSEFEPAGGESNGSAFVLRGQSSGQPSILRPRVTPIQESSMSVSLTATVNTQNNNATDNGYEGLAPTFELLRAENGGVRKLWGNALFGSQRKDLWIAEKRDWHKLTWIQEIPQIGADMLNIGLVNKCPSGYAKVSNMSLTNHYARHYSAAKNGESTISLQRKTERYAVTGRFYRIPAYAVQVYRTRTWHETYISTIPVNISRGEDVTQSVSGIIGAIYDNDATEYMPLRVGIKLKFRTRLGDYVYKDFPDIVSQSPLIDYTEYVHSFSWTADEDYTQIEPIFYASTRIDNGITGINGRHKGIRIEISSKKNLLSSI